jgi:hypothetical protein
LHRGGRSFTSLGSDTVNATVEHPSAVELDQLHGLMSATLLDRAALVAAVRRIEEGLRQRADDLDRAGGLLDEQDRIQRLSLAREEDRLRDGVADLIRDAETVRQAAVGGSDEDDLRRRGGELLAGLRGHRDAEARLLLESAFTEVGSGD